MDAPLRILHLEDSGNDAEIIRLRLGDDGLPCSIECVDTRNDFAARLARKRYDIILADYTLPVIMPMLSGREAYEEVRSLEPRVRFSFMSGYPADIINQKKLLPDEAAIMLKPFSPTALLRHVRDMLDKR